MAQIPEEMGSLSRPSPEFWYDKHTPSRKMTGWCPDIRHFKPLQCVSSVADYTVLSRESRALHLPLNTQLENCYSQSTGSVQLPAGPATVENATDSNVALLRKQPSCRKQPCTNSNRYRTACYVRRETLQRLLHARTLHSTNAVHYQGLEFPTSNVFISKDIAQW